MRKISWTFIGKIALSILFVGFIVAAGFFAYTNRQIISNAITPKPVSFTELYFQNFTTLPTKIVEKNTKYLNKNETSYSFTFTIHNLEKKDMTYSYEVYALGTNKTLLDRKDVFVKNDESKNITETYTMPNIHPSTKVTVDLLQKNQIIFFWMGERLQ